MSQFLKENIIRYTGETFYVEDLSADELFAMFKDIHDMGPETTLQYQTADGLVNWFIEKLSENEIAYTQVWESESQYNEWRQGQPELELVQDWEIE